MPSKRKRGASGGGSIRKRSDGRWEARYTAGHDPKTGKQIQKSIYGKTQKEVREKLTKTLSEIDEGSYMELSKDSLSHWLDIWLKTYVTHSVKPYTVDSYTRICEQHIKPALGRITLDQLESLSIQQFYNALLVEKGLSAKTIKNIHGVLHRALEQAVKLRMLRFNPTELCELPKVTKKEIKPLEEEEVVRFLDAIRGHKFELLYLVTLFTGMRQGEVLGLTWDCVDFERSTLLVNKQHNRAKGEKEYHFSSLKNERVRMLTVAEDVMDVLREQKAWQEQQARALGSAFQNPDNLVFTNELGRFVANQAVYRNYKSIMKKIGLEDMKFHDLRHTFAVNSLKAGDDIKTVQENLGHATASFTLGTYAHATIGMKRESAKRMENYIQSLRKNG